MDNIREIKNLELKLKFISIKKNEVQKELSKLKFNYNQLLFKKSSLRSRINSISFCGTYSANIAYLESYKLKEQVSKLEFKVETLSQSCQKLEANKSNLDSMYEKINNKLRKLKSISKTFSSLVNIEDIIELKTTKALNSTH